MSTPNWTTSQGLIGVYPAQVAMTYTLVAVPADSYQIISGELPPGLSLRSDGLISGTPDIVTTVTTSTFVVRATSGTDIKDRTFELTITGTAAPAFTTPNGPLTDEPIVDSVWQEIEIDYNNPISTNEVSIRVVQGLLPPGLEINQYGLIRGYAEPPVSVTNFQAASTIAVSTSSITNYVTVVATYNMYAGRSIIFTGTAIGNIIPNKTYYIKSVINATDIELCETPFGDTLTLTSGSGFMDVSLPAISVGQPTKRQYNFTLELSSALGTDLANYSITVINFYLPISQGGPDPANPPNTRTPVIYNTQPPTYNIESSADYGFYVLPPAGFSKILNGTLTDVPGLTYNTDENAYIGQFLSGEYIAFKIIGHDFDGNSIVYSFEDLPLGLQADTTTGWIYGTISVAEDYIEEYAFKVAVYKQSKPEIISAIYNFSFEVANNVNGIINWITDSNLGSINNATNCYASVQATCDLPLIYEAVDPENLPPNLTVTETGLIQGIVSYQPSDVYLETETSKTFTFTIKAYNPNMETLVYSERTFTLTVNQYYDIPTDSLYIKCTPSITDRNIIRNLLNDNLLIPAEYIYRPTDPNFGKASSVVYAHAYGIYASDISQYIQAVQKNHYWRNITLGQLKTAAAKDQTGNIIYEVVYSDVIDNLLAYDPAYDYDYRYSTSIPEEIYWPRFIDLHLGPWYTSITDVKTSYIYDQNTILVTNLIAQNIDIQSNSAILTQQGQPTFYTSLTPGYARILYPNSLENMSKRVAQELGVNYNYRLLPLWMTSQQSDGNTLGFTPAWVIAYTLPPEVKTAMADVTYHLTNEIELDNVDNLQIGGRVVFTGNTFGGIVADVTYYVISIDALNNRIQISQSLAGTALELTYAVGTMTATFYISYAEIIKNNIENNWNHTLNEINFQIDRFTVDKQLTYNYDNLLTPNVWTRYPSASPTPEPLDSENFYVLFPQKTILPNRTQYNL